MTDSSPTDLAWILNHLGEDRADHKGSVSPPLFQSSIYGFDTLAQMQAALSDELKNPFYTRGHNPTVATLRAKLAALEGTEDALVFGSGSAAIAAAVIANVSAGDHVVCVQSPYGWTHTLLNDLLPRFGVETSFIDGTDLLLMAESVRENTRLLFLESPNSMTFETQDLRACAALARKHGLVSVCDNSYATPLLQNPHRLGVDIVVHSASKYLNGHSDVVAGALCASDAQIRKIFSGPYMTLGGIIGPFEAWLMLRGLRTLPIRLERVSNTTRTIVAKLREHARVDRVHYPEADEIRRPGGGLFTIELKTDIDGVGRFVNALERFILACSWGGYESLAFPLAGLSASQHYQQSDPNRYRLVRLSIGLEDADVLLADLHQALDAI